MFTPEIRRPVCQYFCATAHDGTVDYSDRFHMWMCEACNEGMRRDNFQALSHEWLTAKIERFDGHNEEYDCQKLGA